MSEVHAYMEALQWYIDHDLAFPVEEEPVNRFVVSDAASILAGLQSSTDSASPVPLSPVSASASAQMGGKEPISAAQLLGNQPAMSAPTPQKKNAADIAGSAAAIAEAKTIAEQCQSLDELKAAIEGFNGIGIKTTATNMVFCDGNPAADIMVIADVPGSDEDRSGKPFSGIKGAFLDKMFAAIGRSRTGDTPENSIYLSSILNWRPPGMRSAEASEIDASLPFIERHIALAAPKLVICIGGAPYKILTGKAVKIMKNSGNVESYTPLVLSDKTPSGVSVTAFFSPDYLMKNPLSKKRAWHDLLKVRALLSGGAES